MGKQKSSRYEWDRQFTDMVFQFNNEGHEYMKKSIAAYMFADYFSDGGGI